MGSSVKALLLAAVTIVVALLLPRELVDDLLAILLALAAGVYVGFGLADAAAGEWRLQAVVALFFGALAFLGLWLSPLILAVGWLLHAGWDWLHHSGKLKTHAAGEYPVLCAVYDVAIAGFIIGYFYV